MLNARNPRELVVARNGSPIVLGIGDGEMFAASDMAALVRHTKHVIHLDDGELATISADAYRTSTMQADRTDKTPATVDLVDEDYQLNGFSEFKHGPLVLIDHTMPSVVIVPDDELLAKNIGTIEQIRARGGPVIAITNADLPEGLAETVIRLPRGEPELDPILFTIPLQLFAYHLATTLGRNVDKPRNLAKSVTVE